MGDIDDEDEDENIFVHKKEVESEQVKCWRYNISITYDVYYQTPRLWLSGVDENKQPLGKEIFDDVMAEHAKKTVTIDPFPHIVSSNQATIHPCEHASVMKKMLDTMVENGI